MAARGLIVAVMGVLLASPLLVPTVRWVGGAVAWGYLAVGAGPGGGPHVRDFNILDGPSENEGEFDLGEDTLASFFPYPLGFTGGVRVAMRAFGFGTNPSGGESDSLLVTGAGPGGGPHVRVFDVKKGTFGVINQVASFFAYVPTFRGGVSVAVADFNTGMQTQATHHIVTGPGPGGGPHVKIFTVRADGSVELFASFFAYAPTFTGGVWVGAGDLDGDGQEEVITGPGPGGGPHVRVFKVSPTGVVTPFAQFFAYNPAFTGGVFVAAGNLDGDPSDELVTGAGPGGGPHVRVWDVSPGGVVTEKQGFLAYNAAFTGGVRVAVGSWDFSQVEQIVTGAGPGGGPRVRSFRLGPASTVLPGPVDFFPFPIGFTGGVFVGANDSK